MDKTTLELPYGHSKVAVKVPTPNLLGVFLPQETKEVFDETGILKNALANPIGTPKLRNLTKKGQKVAIITSDFSRPCPSERMLPLVLDELSAAGVSDNDITIVSALGLHRPMTPRELEELVGSEVYRRVRVINHDPDDTVLLGITSFGTPVEIFRPLVEADFRICLGNLEFHYFAGFSGGAKAIIPGCASKATLNGNHSMMVRPEAMAGRLEGNPVREDLEQGVDMVGVDFILNVLVDGNHHIIGAVAGHVIKAHRQGCEMVAKRGTVPIPRQADVVLVSAGGFPKDVDLYQAQKALDNAAFAVREGGIIILVAECSEGFGNETFEKWMCSACDPLQLLDWIEQEFVLGGHKAAAIASVLKRAKVYLVSTLSADCVHCSNFILFDDLDRAFEAAFDEADPKATIIAIPYGGSTIPYVAK